MIQTLTTEVDGYQLQLSIKLAQTSKTGWPVYDLDIFLNGQRPCELESLPRRTIIQLTKVGLALLDQWCQNQPHSFLVGYEWILEPVWRRISDWGAACDGRLDTWFTCINDQGQRTLYPGVLNLIEDCLNIADLWRVAKDTNYFLGYLETPVDWLNMSFNQAGIRNLLESGYVFEADVQALFASYCDRCQQAAHSLLKFDQHSLGHRPIFVMKFQPDDGSGSVEYRFFYGSRLLGGLQPEQIWISETACHSLLSKNEAVDTNADPTATLAAQLANQLLQLDPNHASEVA